MGYMRTIDETVEQLYRSICFTEGGRPQPEKLLELFIDDGILINNNGELPQVYTVDSFVREFQENVQSGVLKSVDEKEVSQSTDVFGRIAHRWSAYEFRFDKEEKDPVTVGINTIQFILIGNTWYITAMSWNDRTDQSEISERKVALS